MLLVDDMPADERVRRGNVIYRTRGRGPRGHAGSARPRRQPGGGVLRHPPRRRARAVVAGRRSRARARASRPARLAGVRGGVVGAGRDRGCRRSAGVSCGRSRCPRWCSSTPCGACRSSTSRMSTSCSALPGWAARCGTRPGGRSTRAARRRARLQFVLDGRVEVTAPSAPPEQRSARPHRWRSRRFSKATRCGPASAPSSRRSACRSPPRSSCRCWPRTWSWRRASCGG